MIEYKLENKIETEYEAIDENILEIQKRLSEINSSIELIRYLNYLKSKMIEEK